MPKKIEKRGKKRDKWANYTAVIRRSERAWKAYQNGSTEYSKILLDIKERVGMIEKKMRFSNSHPLALSLETWKSKMAEVKKKAVAKRKKAKVVPKKKAPVVEPSVVEEEQELHKKLGFDDEHLLKVIHSLEQGSSHPIFTLLPTEKASLNPSVEVALELKTGKSLCVYKHSLKESG